MNRIIAFSKRNMLEILRDPLSYMFCLGFPLVMLVIMTLVNESIPPEANMTIFRIENLSGGIAVFGLTFVMLFTCLNIAKDRSGAFLVRLYAAPMRSGDFIFGYTMPLLVISAAQVVITFAAALIIAAVTGSELNVGGLLLAAVTLIPTAVMMISVGLLFGCIFGEKAAPGLCSVVISLASFLGGVWFDPDGTGGVMLTICKVLPFYHAVHAARSATALDFDGFGAHLSVTVAYAAVVTIAAVLAFKSKMRADLA